MKALIFSDSHGNAEPMRAAIALHPDAELVLFLGDGLRDAQTVASEHPKLAFVSVAGNMDVFSLFSQGTPEETTLDLDGVRVLLLHGHRRGVKSGEDALYYLAEEKHADVVLYGHTHIPVCRYVSDTERPFYIFNPGSIGRPHGSDYSYGILQIRNKGILLSHGRIDR